MNKNKFNPLWLLVLFFSTSTLLSADRTFSQRYTTNLKGNMKVIGNTVMTANPVTTIDNGSANMVYVDIDTDPNTFNSSSADINITESGIDISTAKVAWAGLYWQGYLHTWDANDDNGNANNQYTNLTTPGDLDAAINTHTIQFTTPNQTLSIRPDEIDANRVQNDPGFLINGVSANAPGYHKINYSCFADVTEHLRDNALHGTYTVANVPSQQGRTSRSAFNAGNRTWYDGLGNYGAWALVVIYDNNTSAVEKTRNFSIYDGYVTMAGTNDPGQTLNTSETINFSGFKTPKSAPDGVDSVISIFAGEGDARIGSVGHTNEDSARITNQDGEVYQLPNPPGRTNYFSSAIDGVPLREPLIDDNKGIDIHVQQIGTKGLIDGNETGRIRENQTSASITLLTQTGQNAAFADTYMPSMVAFSTELFTPELCYDYDVRIGDHIKIPSDNREINTNAWTDDLTLTLLIRSEISDFPIINSKLNVDFSPSTLTYVHNSSQVSPPDINVYYPINDIDSAQGQIGIGRGSNTLLESDGGIIGAFETTFAKQSFSFGSLSRYDGKFEIEVNGEIQFDPNANPIPFELGTGFPSDSPYHIGRCNTNPVYDPIWANFNIERDDSHLYTNPAEKYPLYTQIAGQPFNVSVVSYTLDNNGEYTVPIESNTTVELELIDASVFDNNKSVGYDSTCEEPSAEGTGAFINLADDSGNPQLRKDVQIPDDMPDFGNTLALQSAAFRLWVITVKENNGTKRIIPHSCKLDGTTPNCMKSLYQDQIRPYDSNATLGIYCQNACNASSSDQGCYDCLKSFYATPICSRDNFSIRPESYSVAIHDNNQTDNNVTRTPLGLTLTDNDSSAGNLNPNLSIAAGYNYMIDINATLFGDTGIAQAYYNENFDAASFITNLGSATDDNTIAALEFNDATACNDQTHRTYNIRFQNGRVDPNTFISHSNAGNYQFWMLDSNWTNVDRASYPNKVRFGDCVIGDTRPVCSDCDFDNPSTSQRNANGKLGCVINSNVNSGNAITDNNYNNIPLRLQPYAFDLSQINFSIPNAMGTLYMNNLNTATDADRSMSAELNGTIIAQGADGIRLTNFTNGCAANPVMFDMDRTLSRDGVLLDENNLTSIDTTSVIPQPQRVYFQRYDNSRDVNNTTPRFSLEDDVTGTSTAITISRQQFRNDSNLTNGTAQLNLDYNFIRPGCQVVDPLTMFFNIQEANSTASTSAANMRLNYIPRGDANISRTANFIYGRIAADSSTPYIVPAIEDTVTIGMYAEAYCSLALNCANYRLNTASLRDPDEWWINNDHNSTTDGQIASLYAYTPPALVNIVPNGTPDPINLSNPTSVTVTINPTAVRPYQTPIMVMPSVPWLTYNPNRTNCPAGNPGTPLPNPNPPTPGVLDPLITFLGGGGWGGKGNTGLVVEVNASSDPFNSRTSW